MAFILNGLVVVFLFLLIYRRNTKNVVEVLSLLWLKSIVAIVALYLMQFISSSYGLFIPINLFTVSVIMLFNVPGIVGLGMLYKLI